MTDQDDRINALIEQTADEIAGIIAGADGIDPDDLVELIDVPLKELGGVGSGHFGHEGRPGEVGGSQPSNESVDAEAERLAEEHQSEYENNRAELERKLLEKYGEGDWETGIWIGPSGKFLAPLEDHQETALDLLGWEVDITTQEGAEKGADATDVIVNMGIIRYNESPGEIFVDLPSNLSDVTDDQWTALAILVVSSARGHRQWPNAIVTQGGPFSPSDGDSGRLDAYWLYDMLDLDPADIYRPFVAFRGGPGSGHFGHEGRPGEVGGSLPSGTAEAVRPRPGGPTTERGRRLHDIHNRLKEANPLSVEWAELARDLIEAGVSYFLDRDVRMVREEIDSVHRSKGWRIYDGDNRLTLQYNGSSEVSEIGEPEMVLTWISADVKGTGLGSAFMRAAKYFADTTGMPFRILFVTNNAFYQRFPWLEKITEGVVHGADRYIYRPSTPNMRIERSEDELEEYDLTISPHHPDGKHWIPNDAIVLRGGPGSGHFGHEGRPGEVGGSKPSGATGAVEPATMYDPGEENIFLELWHDSETNEKMKQNIEDLLIEVERETGYQMKDVIITSDPLEFAKFAKQSWVDERYEAGWSDNDIREAIGERLMGDTPFSFARQQHPTESGQPRKKMLFMNALSRFFPKPMSWNYTYFLLHEIAHEMQATLDMDRHPFGYNPPMDYLDRVMHYKDAQRDDEYRSDLFASYFAGEAPNGRISWASRQTTDDEYGYPRLNPPIPMTDEETETARELIEVIRDEVAEQEVVERAASDPEPFIIKGPKGGRLEGVNQSPEGTDCIVMDDDFWQSISDALAERGGPGSGHFGHEGRPGEVGGSAPSGGWWQDNPAARGIDWTAGPNQMTAGYREAKVDPRDVARLPGARGEHRNIDRERVAELAESIKREGLKHKPLIIIEQDGTAHIWEGNHRIRAAIEAGLDSIIVEIRYFGGSEEKPGIWKPRLVERGGPGSGHFGHEGRPGEVGGSQPSGAADEIKHRPINQELGIMEGLISAWIDGDQVGSLAFGLPTRMSLVERGYDLELGWINVREPFRGRGIATQMMDRFWAEYGDRRIAPFETTPEGMKFMKRYFGDRGIAYDTAGNMMWRVQDEQAITERGGPGSGHHGHRGRPGEIGGSLPDDGELPMSMSLTDADRANLIEQGIVLHASSSNFPKFDVDKTPHGAIYFSDPATAGPNRKTQAEHIALGPFGGRLIFARLDLDKAQWFDPGNDERARNIFRRIFPDAINTMGTSSGRGYFNDLIGYVFVPELVQDREFQEAGYNAIRVWEPAVSGESIAITDNDLVEIIGDTRERDESMVERGGPGSGHFGHEGRPGEVGGSKPSGIKGSQDIFIGVPADYDKFPPGTKAMDMHSITQQSGAPIRGDQVIDPNDPKIPDYVYHMTTNLPGILQSGEISARGVGGLGGDRMDQIVSMTISRQLALQLANDIRIVISVAREFLPTQPQYVFPDKREEGGPPFVDRNTGEPLTEEDYREWATGLLNRLNELDQSDRGDWRFTWDFDYTDPAYIISDWVRQYFNERDFKAGITNPLFMSDVEVYASRDPDLVGVVAVPRENLDTGALLMDFDLSNQYGLQEVRLYGDLPLDNAEIIDGQMVERGGPGSGHFGHAGRPGEVGGSLPSGEAETVSIYGYDDRPPLLAENLEAARQDIQHLDYEVAYLFAPDGEKTLHKTEQLADAVNFTEEEFLKFDDAVLVHNHPRSTAISIDDIAIAIMGGSREVIVFARDGKIYVARLNRFLIGETEHMRHNAWNALVRVNAAIRAKFTQAIRAGTMTPEEADAEHNNAVMELFAREYDVLEYIVIDGEES